MPTPCWLKHLCSIRAWIPMSVFVSVSLSVSLSLYIYIYIYIYICVCVCFWRIPWNLKADCITQGILASFLLSLSHRQLQTTRFQSNKGPRLCVWALGRLSWPEPWEQGVTWMLARCELLTLSHQTHVPALLEQGTHLSPLLSSLTCKTQQIHNTWL